MHNIARKDEATAALASAIGARVRHERQARGWTLDRLANAAGVSRRMVINVEQGAVNPSIGTLLRISDALGVGLPALVELPQPKRIRVTRRGHGAALWDSDLGGRGVLLAGTDPPDVVELWDFTLAPGDDYQSEPHAAGTMELVQVQRGTMVVTAGGETATLDAGDTAVFPGDVPHAYANPDRELARFSLVVFEPRVGSGHAMEGTHG